MNREKHKNRLAHAASPYLLAHAENPVDWYEWGEEAFARARSEDKPIFLSVGYNACHWCHVMEHESFENEEIAEILNKYYVSIKVDREERPDIDQIYMSALQALTGSGGWPMSIFMTPDKKPFFAGTYFPPQSLYGRPGFKDVLIQLAEGYRTQKSEILTSADSIVDHIAKMSEAAIPGRSISRDVVVSAAKMIYSAFDSRFGGFGSAPKFPQATNLSLLFRAAQLSGGRLFDEAALYTLRRMAEGGIYDQIGGGFHRYSTDEQWLVPHFEKMLYDNALLVIPYLEAYQMTGETYYLDVVDGILKYLRDEMTGPEGGLYSTQDADSEGEEGKYYLWSRKEAFGILGEDAEWFCRYFDITEQGNFEGRNIPNRGDHSLDIQRAMSLDETTFHDKIERAKSLLLAERRKRVPPGVDDKILSSWNGLAISALAQAAQVTGDESYLVSAKRAADFVLSKMVENGSLFHSYREGQLLRAELLEDYAYFVAGLIDLYQATFDEYYLGMAAELTRRAVDIFLADNLFYSAPADNSDLIYRPRELTDGAIPSPASVIILDLLRLAAITGDEYFNEIGLTSLNAVSGLAAQVPQASAALLIAGYFNLTGPIEIVVSGHEPDKMRKLNRVIFSRFIPNKIVVGSVNGRDSNLPLLEGRQEADRLTYYFCIDRSCRLPVYDEAGLNEELDWAMSQAK